MLSNRPSWRAFIRRVTVLAIVPWVAIGCADIHETPQGGTETGNPPVIDARFVALVVTPDAVRVEGGAGAVSPGLLPVQAVSITSGQVFSTTAKADGSFSIPVTTGPFDAFEVRAGTEDKNSEPVFVVRGAAAVTSGTDAGLSCIQREDLATQQLIAVANGASRQCATDQDCVVAGVKNDCSDACEQFPVSLAGQSDIENARAALNGGICRDFASDGCTASSQQCVQRIELAACVAGQCAWVSPDAPSAQDCRRVPACVDGADETLSNVCFRQLTELPSAGIASACFVTRDGTLALAHVGTSEVPTNDGWTHSAYGDGIVRTTLTPQDEERCAVMQQSWDLDSEGRCVAR